MCFDDASLEEKRPDFGRAGTAPALRHTRTLDLEEETPAGANDGDDAEATGQETEEAPDEESSCLRDGTRGSPAQPTYPEISFIVDCLRPRRVHNSFLLFRSFTRDAQGCRSSVRGVNVGQRTKTEVSREGNTATCVS